MTKLPYLRTKKAKGRTYYYFDLGNAADGRRVLSKLPDIRDPRFGDCYARAKATRANRRNKQGTLTLEGLIHSYEKSPEFRCLATASQTSYTRYLAKANSLIRTRGGDSPPRQVDRARRHREAARDNGRHTWSCQSGAPRPERPLQVGR
jgi:hypothetical protein